MKVGTIGLLAVGILFSLPVLQNEAVTKFASSGKGRLSRSCSSSSPAGPCPGSTP